MFVLLVIVAFFATLILSFFPYVQVGISLSNIMPNITSLSGRSCL